MTLEPLQTNNQPVTDLLKFAVRRFRRVFPQPATANAP